MFTVQHLDSPPDTFLSESPEGAAFFRAFKESHIEGIRTAWLAVYRDGVQVSIVPYFVTDFHANTMLPEGWLKKLLGWLKFKIACVGHPALDLGCIDGDTSADILQVVNTELFKKSSLVSYKNFPHDMPLVGFVGVKNLPQAMLPLQGDYYSQLNSKKRNDLKRKLKRAASIRCVEHCGRSAGLDAQLADNIHQLYLNTLARADFKLETLTREYFLLTASMSTFLLFYEDEQLIGFVQILGKSPRMASKFVGMDYERGKQYGIWFLMCLRTIEFCVRQECQQVEFGPTSYCFKRFLGCVMTDTWVYFRHKNRVANWFLGKFAFLLEPSESELQ